MVYIQTFGLMNKKYQENNDSKIKSGKPIDFKISTIYLR